MRTIVFLATALALVASSAAEPEPGPPGETLPGTGVPGDDDPRIEPSEVLAPSIDSRDAAWEPAYKWFEDPESLDCGRREACEAHKANATQEA